MKFFNAILGLFGASAALAGVCNVYCEDESNNCSTAGNQIFVYYQNSLCYIGDIITGPQDVSVSLVGDDFTNESDVTLISRIRQRKYQVNGWLYCPSAPKSQNYSRVSKVRLENLEGTNGNIQCRKADNMKGVVTAGPFTNNPITHASVTSVNQLDANIGSEKITLVNNVTYLDENNDPVFKCTEPVSYNIYYGEDSWVSCQ